MGEIDEYWNNFVGRLKKSLFCFNNKKSIYKSLSSSRKIKIDYEILSFNFLKIYCWGVLYYDFKIRIEYFSKKARVLIRYKNVDHLDLNPKIYSFIRAAFPDFRVLPYKYTRKY